MQSNNWWVKILANAINFLYKILFYILWRSFLVTMFFFEDFMQSEFSSSGWKGCVFSQSYCERRWWCNICVGNWYRKLTFYFCIVIFGWMTLTHLFSSVDPKSKHVTYVYSWLVWLNLFKLVYKKPSLKLLSTSEPRWWSSFRPSIP